MQAFSKCVDEDLASQSTTGSITSLASAQDFAREARHALQTVGALTRHMAASAAASQASRQHSGEDAQLAHHCTRKEAALEKAQSAE